MTWAKIAQRIMVSSQSVYSIWVICTQLRTLGFSTLIPKMFTQKIPHFICSVVFTAGLDIRPKLSQPCKLQFYYAFSLFETDSLIRFVLEYLYGLTHLTACDLHRI